MKKILFCVLLLPGLCQILLSAEWKITLNRDNALYSCGEEAVFTVSVLVNGEPVLEGKGTLLFTLDGGRKIASYALALDESHPAVFRMTLDQPGFLRGVVLDVEPETLRPKGVPTATAGFEPEKIRPAIPAPADFRQFWDRKITESRQMPADIQMEKLEKYSKAEYSCFKISSAVAGNERVFGILCLPSDPGRKYPLLLTVPGAGPANVRPPQSASEIILMMNILRHDIIPDNSEHAKELYERDNSENGLYMRRGCTDPDQYYFLQSYLGILKVLQHVKTLEQWNGLDLIIAGSSQGGGSALILSALEPATSVTVANVPALCDHQGSAAGRQPGWPQIMNWTANQTDQAAAAQAMAYFDVVNFCPYIKSPTLIAVGFIDATCPPSGIYAAYNMLAGEKKILHDVLGGHRVSSLYLAENPKWIAAYAKKKRLFQGNGM